MARAHENIDNPEMRREPTQIHVLWMGTTPPKPTSVLGKERVRALRARMKKDTAIIHGRKAARPTAVVVRGKVWQSRR